MKRPVYSLEVACAQIAKFSGNFVFCKLICSEMEDLIRLQGVTEDWPDVCVRSAISCDSQTGVFVGRQFTSK